MASSAVITLLFLLFISFAFPLSSPGFGGGCDDFSSPAPLRDGRRVDIPSGH
jgi:hypothetical protein